MEGKALMASWRLAANGEGAHPEAHVCPVGTALVAWVPDESDEYSGSAAVSYTVDGLAAKLDGG